MAHGFQRLTSILSGISVDFRCLGGEQFASTHPDYRSRLRRSIADKFSDESLLDLSSPPSPEGWSVSISHCREFGGWLALPEPFSIGFDVEEASRISSRILERVCPSDELAEAPQRELLWAAKESLFKALGVLQPVTITELRVGSWSDAGDGVYSFTAAGPGTIRGYATGNEHILFAACIVSQ